MAMQRYQLDHKKPRQLIPDEAQRLAETPIDYSDIPPACHRSAARSCATDGTTSARSMQGARSRRGRRSDDARGVASLAQWLRATHFRDSRTSEASAQTLRGRQRAI